MRNKSIFSALFLATSLIMTPIFALAAPGGEGGANPMAAVMKELNLSPGQAAGIKQIHAQAQPQIEAARAKMKADKANLHLQVASAEATDAQLRTLYAQVSSDAQAMHKLRFEMLLKVRAVLTPAQRQQAAALLQQKHKQWGEHDHGHEHGGGDF